MSVWFAVSVLLFLSVLAGIFWWKAVSFYRRIR
jgi:hypothetical protein